MAAPRKKPQRTCVVCKTCRDKSDLIRIVLKEDGSVAFDPSGKMAGRGAYLCKDQACIEAELKKSGRLSKGLRHQLDKDNIETVLKEILKECL